jgi:hypothetical protein
MPLKEFLFRLGGVAFLVGCVLHYPVQVLVHPSPFLD